MKRLLVLTPTLKLWRTCTALAAIVAAMCAGPAWAVDYVVTNLTIDNCFPTYGSTVTLTATVKNTNTASATIPVRFYNGDFDDNYVTNAKAIRKTVALTPDKTITLAAGASGNVSITYVATNEPYYYNFHARVDPANSVTETNEDNNYKNVRARTRGNCVEFNILAVVFPNRENGVTLTAATKQKINEALNNLKAFLWDNTLTVKLNIYTVEDSRLVKDGASGNLTDMGGYYYCTDTSPLINDYMAEKWPTPNTFDMVMAFWATKIEDSPIPYAGLGGGPFWNKWGNTSFVTIPMNNTNFVGGDPASYGIHMVLVHELLHPIDFIFSYCCDPNASDRYNGDLGCYGTGKSFKSPQDMSTEVTWATGNATNEWHYYRWMLETWPTLRWLDGRLILDANRFAKETGLLSITSPRNGETVLNNGSYSIKVEAPENMKSIITKVGIFINGVLKSTIFSPPYIYLWCPAETKSTSCNIEARAYVGDVVVGASSIIVTKGAQTFYNTLNVGGTANVVDPTTGANVAFTLSELYVYNNTRYARISISGQPTINDAQAGQMYRVSSSCGLFVYVATIFDGDMGRFAELMIAPYQYPSVDILCPQPGEYTNSNVVKVAANYCSANVPWTGAGNPPVNPYTLKTLSYNGASTVEETYVWTLSGTAGARTMTVSITDKLGTTSSKSVTVNYDPTKPFYVYRGPFSGADGIMKNLSIWGSSNPAVANIRVSYRADGYMYYDQSCTYRNRDGELEMYAQHIAGRAVGCDVPSGASGVYVVDKNQYLNNSFSSAFGHSAFKYYELYDHLAYILGKDVAGNYRVWYGTNADRSGAVPIPALHLPAPPAPTYSNVLENSVEVNWKNLEGEAGYDVQRSADGGVTWSTIQSLGPDVTSYTNAGLTSGATYSYRIIGKHTSTYANVTGAASAITTVNGDGTTNGNFEGSGAWTFTGGSSIRIADDKATDGPYSGTYYGKFQIGPASWYQGGSGEMKTTLYIPNDAVTLKYAIKVYTMYPWMQGCNEAPNIVSYLNATVLRGYGGYGPGSLRPWGMESFDISGYRGTTAVLKFYSSVGAWGGDCGFGVDDVSIVGTVPTVSITSPASGGSVLTEAATTITATAADAYGTINRVEFYVDGAYLGVDNTSPYTCLWTPVIAKSYSIMAKAFDMSGNTNTHTITVTATGLVGHWKLDGTSGTVAADNSGNDNNGTLVNGPTWLAGQVGNGLSFNSDVGGDGLFCYNGEVRQGVSIPDNNSLDITSAITVAGWFKLGSTGSGHSLACKWNAYDVRIQPDGIWSAFWGLQPDNGHIFAATTINRGQWYHTTVIYDGAAIKIYLNGALLRSVNQTGALTANGSALWIGSNDGGGQFSGSIDEVRIYSRALSAAEVQVLYTSGGGTLVDNFSDLNYTSNPTWTNVTDWGVGGYLNASTGALEIYQTADAGNSARTASTMAYGTWQMDFKLGSRGGCSNTRLIWYFIESGSSHYYVRVQNTANSIKIGKQTGDLATASFTPVDGTWYNLKITRTSGGQFQVFINGALKLTATDNGLATSSTTRIASQRDCGYADIFVDNIRIDNRLLFDDFSDLNYTSNPTWTNVTDWGVGGYLNASTGALEIYQTADAGNSARTASTMAYGTWQMDFKLGSRGGCSNTRLIWYFIESGSSHYYVRVQNTSNSIKIGKQTGDLATASFTPVDGTWYNLKVTRTSGGQFQVFINGVLKLTATDNGLTTSSTTRIASQRDCGYADIFVDNISINDYVKSANIVTMLEKPQLPTTTQLLYCAPNPTNGQTAINFQLAQPAQTTIKVYNLMGQVIKTLVNECLRPGYHAVKWDGKDANGNKVAAGVYLYRMEAGDYSKTNKLTVLR